MNRQLTARVFGGLGNQLFIYAAASALSDKLGRQLILDADAFQYDLTYRRTYLLDRFNGIRAVHKPRENIAVKQRVARAIVRRLSKQLPLKYRRYLSEPRPPQYIEVNREYGEFHDRITMEGYWQTSKFFQHQRALLKIELGAAPILDNIAQKELQAIQNSQHPVALGVRLFREVAGADLKEERIVATFRDEILNAKAEVPSSEFFLFTEEPDRLRGAFAELNVPVKTITHRPANEHAFQNVFLMQQCRQYIIGISSYHWWGAWLSQSEEAVVTCIQTDKLPNIDYFPKSWREVELKK